MVMVSVIGVIGTFFILPMHETLGKSVCGQIKELESEVVKNKKQKDKKFVFQQKTV